MTTDTVGTRGESGLTGTALRALFERLLLSKERDDRPELAGRGARDNGDLLDLDMDLPTPTSSCGGRSSASVRRSSSASAVVKPVAGTTLMRMRVGVSCTTCASRK